MTAPAGALSIFPTTAVVAAPAGALSLFSHCPSSACPRRSFPFVSPLPQQCLLQQERYLYFLTTAVVTAPPWALPVFPTATAVSAPAGALPVFPTAAAVPAPAGAQYIFPHCRSSARSRRSLPSISPLPQQCPLPQELHQYLPTAAAVFAPAGAPYIFPHCRSSIYPHILPPLPTPPHQHTSAEAASSSRCRSIPTSIVQHPISPKTMHFLGGLLAYLAAVPR